MGRKGRGKGREGVRKERGDIKENVGFPSITLNFAAGQLLQTSLGFFEVVSFIKYTICTIKVLNVSFLPVTI